MTVNSNDLLVGPVVPSNGTTLISIDFYFEDETHLEVYKSGSNTPLSLGVDYTVSEPTSDGATDGSITLAVAANGSDSYSIFGKQPLERSSDVQFRGDYRSEVINQSLDRLWRAVQGINTALTRTFRFSATSNVADELESVTAAGRQSKALVFSADGSALELGPTTDDIENAQTYAGNASTSASEAAASAAAAATSETNAAASETAAAASETAAATSETNAAASETAAAASETAAATSETNAAASETAAAASETAAATSETNAAASETAAAASETAAATSETNAAASASAAAASETAAATSETNAAASETAAAASETAAATSETNAAASESAAATSETNAGASETAAAASAAAAATSETNAAASESAAATSETNAGASETAAAASAAAAAASYDDFDDRYLGPFASDPATDNDGDPLLAGALYFNTTSNEMRVWDGAAWQAAYVSLAGALLASNNLSDLDDASIARSNLGLGSAATTSSSDYATAAQGGKADTALQPADLVTQSNATWEAGSSTTEGIVSPAKVKAAVDALAPQPGLVPLATATASNDAVMDFTAFDSSLYDSYVFVLSNVVTATDGAYLGFRTSTDGGANFDFGSSDYHVIIKAAASDGASLDYADSTENMAYVSFNVGSGSGEDGVSGLLHAFGAHANKTTQFVVHSSYENNGGDLETCWGAGMRASSADVDAIRFRCSSGNIESGTVTMYGRKKV